MTQENSPQYFRVPAQVQLIVEPLPTEESRKQKELELSSPNPHSSFREALETQVRAADMPPRNQELLSRTFELLLSMEQRLHRIEDFIYRKERGEPARLYSWASIEIGGETCLIPKSFLNNLKAGDVFALDLVLPCVPEFRCQFLARYDSEKNEKVLCHYVKIHTQDQEQIYRFVRQREREIIRESQKAPTS